MLAGVNALFDGERLVRGTLFDRWGSADPRRPSGARLQGRRHRSV